MKRKSVIVLTIMFTLANRSSFSWCPVHRDRRSRAARLHGFVQGVLPTANQFAPTDTWGGPSFSTLAESFSKGARLAMTEPSIHTDRYRS